MHKYGGTWRHPDFRFRLMAIEATDRDAYERNFLDTGRLLVGVSTDQYERESPRRAP